MQCHPPEETMAKDKSRPPSTPPLKQEQPAAGFTSAADVVREAHRRNGEIAGATVAQEAVSGEEARRLSDAVQPALREPALTTQLDACEKCGQSGEAKGGEYPCEKCGRPVLHDDAPVTEEKRGPTEHEARETLLEDLLAILAPMRREGETAPQVAQRMVDTLAGLAPVVQALQAEAAPDETLAEAMARVRGYAREAVGYKAQLQPAHNALGKHATARGVIVSHVASTSKDYDTGGRYRLALVTVEKGVVTVSEAVDVMAGAVSEELTFGLVRDHLEKRVEDFITPKAHRS
jgi:hypothetical protein